MCFAPRRREQILATISDIAGEPIPPRNRVKRELRSRDLRDILKILMVMAIIITGFFLFAPARDGAQDMRVAAKQKAQG
jgi:hypothetical protein